MDSHLTSLLTFFPDPEATVGHELLSLQCVRNSKRASFTRPASACGCPHLCEEAGGARVELGSKRMLSFSTSYPHASSLTSFTLRPQGRHLCTDRSDVSYDCCPMEK